MSNTLAPTAPNRTKSVNRRRFVLGAALAVGALVALAIPLYVSAYWLQLALAVCALGVGAIGMTMLTGVAGQLSLANPFFMMLGALTYVVCSSQPEPGGDLVGLGLHPVVGACAGVGVAGIAGIAFSPISSRLNGIYLGMASLGLVFLCQHIFNNAESLTGGFNGRRVPDFEVFGIVFGRSADPLVIFGVPYGRLEWLWYLGISCLVLSGLFARNILRSRPGRAFRLIGSGPLTASAAGVHVGGYKARIFFLSSLYAGLSGVLYGISIGSIAPQSFGFDLSLQFLAMIVIGGLGSVSGAVAGAAFIVCLPVVMQSVLGGITFLESGSLTVSHLARYVYGAAIIAVLLFKPGGFAGIWRSALSAARTRRKAHQPTESESS